MENVLIPYLVGVGALLLGGIIVLKYVLGKLDNIYQISHEIRTNNNDSYLRDRNNDLSREIIGYCVENSALKKEVECLEQYRKWFRDINENTNIILHDGQQYRVDEKALHEKTGEPPYLVITAKQIGPTK